MRPFARNVNGVYTAPDSDSIPGTSKRVIVKAVSGENVSRALVTVIPRSVSVYPFLQTAQYSPERPSKPSHYVLVGGSLGAPLTWTMGANAKGSVRAVNGEDSDLDSRRRVRRC